MSDKADVKLNPWHPMTNSIDLKHLGKLSEECSELGAAIARCIIQGIDESEPITGKENKQWLEDEIADVLAGIELCQERFKLNIDKIIDRKEKKKKCLAEWHYMA